MEHYFYEVGYPTYWLNKVQLHLPERAWGTGYKGSEGVFIKN